jgi:hypothetical protein
LPYADYNPQMAKHGTRTAYKDGCRCTECTAANTEYFRKYNAANPRNEYHRQYRLKTIEREREAKRRWREENPEKRKEAQRRYRKSNPWRLHHINRQIFTALLKSQGGKCAGCGRSMEDYGRVFDVDHDHTCCPKRFSCGKCIRGLVCRSCNLRNALATS